MKDDLRSELRLMKSIRRIGALTRWRISIWRIWRLLLSAWPCGCKRWSERGVYVSSGTQSKYGSKLKELGSIGTLTAVATVREILKIVDRSGVGPMAAKRASYTQSQPRCFTSSPSVEQQQLMHSITCSTIQKIASKPDVMLSCVDRKSVV